MGKIYLIDFLKEHLEKNNKNQLINYNRKNIIEVNDEREFLNFLNEFKTKEIIDEELVNSILNHYFPENLLKSIQYSSISTETANELKHIIDSLFYTNIEENSLINDLSIQKFISFIFNEIIKQIVVEYCFANFQEDNLLTNSVNNLELLEFEFMNKYNFLGYYFSSFVHLLTVFLAIESDTFTRNIEINDEIKHNLLEDTSKFYNVIIEAYSKLRKDLFIFRINILQDKRFLPNKKDILRYDCYESLDELLLSLDDSISKLDLIISELKNHKKLMRNKISKNKEETKKRVKEITLFVAELIGKILCNFK